ETEAARARRARPHLPPAERRPARAVRGDRRGDEAARAPAGRPLPRGARPVAGAHAPGGRPDARECGDREGRSVRPIIRWDPMPEAVRQIIRPLLVQYLWLLPTWCHLLRVGYQTDEEGLEGAQAVTSASVEYRHARIVFCGEWLTSNPTERRLTVIHELLHVPLAQMSFEHSHQ